VLLEEVRYVTMETAACLCCNKISNYIMFTSTLNTDTQGVMGVTRGGRGIARVHIYNWLNERKAYQLKPSTR
jgi:hypothetical protein